ncbi:hypothetical protein [Butyrivibrio sp. AE3006]|nr:hypothetical protein [Butyrivibrio sp. AE3006]
MCNCSQVLEIIKKNGGKEYRSPARILDTIESNRMSNLYNESMQGEKNM